MRTRLAVAALLALLSAGESTAQEATNIRDFRLGPGKAITAVTVEVPNATITVEGWSGDSARVELTAAADRRGELPTVLVREGHLLIADPANQEALKVVVRVPRRVDLAVRAANAGAVRVSGLHGSLELENSNAGIFIGGSRGGIVAATSNGPIIAVVSARPTAPMSFLTSNDPVRVVLPDGSDLDVLLETDNARVRSEFVVEPDAAQPPAGEEQRSLRGRVGAGGPLLRVRTSNGDILLEQIAP